MAIGFPISRDPPEGGTKGTLKPCPFALLTFPISRDPPEGGTSHVYTLRVTRETFPISRDPPEGGTEPL